MGQATMSIKIANGQSLQTDSLHLQDYALVGIQMPVAWDAAALTFQASYDNGVAFPFANVYDNDGSEYTIVVAQARYVPIKPTAILPGLRWIKVRSGTQGVPVAQTADRIIGLFLAHFGG